MNFLDTLGTNVETFCVRGGNEMNPKFQRMSGAGGEPRRHGPSGGGGPFSTGYSLRPLSPGG